MAKNSPLDKAKVESILKSSLPDELCEDLIEEYLQIRKDSSTKTLGRSAPGKFVETFVQCLEYIETKKYAKKPDVDKFLVSIESRPSPLRDDLRICASRIARSMYTLRNKRSIAHKGEVDPNSYDLKFLLAGAQWILAELVRVAGGVSMEEAGRAIDLIFAPVGTLVEDIADRRLVLKDVSAPDEILILLQSYYPTPQSLQSITYSLNRRNSKSVANAVRSLYTRKKIEGDNKNGYILTSAGLNRAIELTQIS